MQICKVFTLVFLFTTLLVAGRAPEWVTTKPVSSSSYTGIGVAVKGQFKSKDEWIKASESRALSSISEAISIQIQGSSNLTQTATNSKINDLYQENIRTFTNANLEGYEFVEAWENNKEYWVYYKLDKAIWQSIEQKRLREAVSKSQAYLTNADQMKASGNVVSAIRGYSQAYGELLPVLHLDPRFTINGTAVPAVAQIDNNLVSLLNSLIIDMKSPLYSGAQSAFVSKEPKITLRTSTAVAGSFPLIICDQKRITGGDGSISIGNSYVLGKLPDASGEIRIPITTDIQQFVPVQPANPIISEWLVKQKWPTGSALIRFTKPAVFVALDESNYSDLPKDEIETAVKSQLTTSGFSLGKYAGESDFRVTIKCSSRAGGSMGNLYFSYIDASWSLFNLAGDELMTETLPPVKDGALSYDDATIKACKKAEAILGNRISTWMKENCK